MFRKVIAETDLFKVYLLKNDVLSQFGLNDGKRYIVKIYNKTETDMIKNIAEEFENQNIAANAGLAPKAVYHSLNYIIMEHIENDDSDLLSDIINGIEIKSDDWTYIDDPKIDRIVIDGIDKLHNLHVLHGDLQPQNIIIKNDKIYFINFHFSKYLPDEDVDYLNDEDQFVQWL